MNKEKRFSDENDRLKTFNTKKLVYFSEK